jgi:hypothetical protein
VTHNLLPSAEGAHGCRRHRRPLESRQILEKQKLRCPNLESIKGLTTYESKLLSSLCHCRKSSVALLIPCVVPQCFSRVLVQSKSAPDKDCPSMYCNRATTFKALHCIERNAVFHSWFVGGALSYERGKFAATAHIDTVRRECRASASQR